MRLDMVRVPPHRPRSIRARLPQVAALALLLGGCEGKPLGPSSPDAEPPVPADLSQFDGELTRAIEQGVALARRASSSAAAWMELGMTYEAHNLHDYALPCYLQASELAPDDPKAWYRLGIAAGNEGDAGLALGSLERVVELAPDYAPARRRLARWYLDLGETAKARAAFEAALALEPEDLSARIGLAQVELEEDDPSAAIARLAAAEFQRGPQAALAHRVRGLAMIRLGAPGAALELERGEGAKPGGSDPWSRAVAERKVGESALLMRAGRLIDRGQAEAGVELLEELVKTAPDDARVQRRLAKGYALLARWSDAARALSRAIELEPDDPELFLALAAARSPAGDRPGTIEALEGALALAPAHAQAAEQLAALLLEDGRFDDVAAHCERARAAGLASAALEIAAGKAAIERADAASARACFERASELDPAAADAWAGLAWALARSGEREPARGALDKARALDARHPLIAAIEAALEPPPTPEGSPGDGP